MDTNKVNHIFANPDHNFDAFVRDLGSEAAAFRAIEDAVNQAFQAGKISTNQFCRYQQAFEVGRFSVTVRGRIVSGLPCIGTAWVLVLWGWEVKLQPLKRRLRRLVHSVFEPRWKGEENNA